MAGGRRFIVDAGSGIMQLNDGLNPQAGDHFDILLTHLHHDHVMGLMAFQPCFTPGATVHLYCGNLDGGTAEVPLRRLFSPPLFPLTFDELPATLRFIGFTAGEILPFGGVTIRTHFLNHPGGATGYRFETAGRAAVVLTDLEHLEAGPGADLVAFCRNADLIVYDATWDVADYPRFRGWGHSTWAEGAKLARAARVPRLACFHHAPDYDDARIAAMEIALQAEFAGGFFAREGQVLDLEARSRATLAADTGQLPR
jgi:phosphoribosyl 1,2-cyclic phosphodiesterase